MTDNVFTVREGEFGVDGLVTCWPVHTATTSDAAFAWIIEQFEAGNVDAVAFWVEERTAEGESVWVDEPYPQKKRPDFPDWFHPRIREIDAKQRAQATG